MTPWREHEVRHLLAQWQAGERVSQIAAVMGKSRSAICGQLKRLRDQGVDVDKGRSPKTINRSVKVETWAEFLEREAAEIQRIRQEMRRGWLETVKAASSCKSEAARMVGIERTHLNTTVAAVGFEWPKPPKKEVVKKPKNTDGMTHKQREDYRFLRDRHGYTAAEARKAVLGADA